MTLGDATSGNWTKPEGRPAILPWEEDRRTTARRKFYCQQYIAFTSKSRLPKSGEFRQVRCLDLSPYGLSFLLNQQPEAKSFVVAFGDPEQGSLIAAEIVSVDAVVLDNETTYRVGCRFVGERFER